MVRIVDIVDGHSYPRLTWLEKMQMQKAPSGVVAGNGKGFPPEANAYNDDVSARVVKELRAERGVDVSNPRWKTIEALGQVVRAT